jgi:hypothetical protein
MVVQSCSGLGWRAGSLCLLSIIYYLHFATEKGHKLG